DAAAEQAPHRVYPAIPAVEIADHADALRIRRPDREVNAVDATDVAQMRPEMFVELQMISLREQMQIDFAHDKSVAVGIADERGRSIPAGEMNAVIDVAFHSRQRGLEKSFRPEAVRLEALVLFVRHDDADLFCVRSKDP